MLDQGMVEEEKRALPVFDLGDPGKVGRSCQILEQGVEGAVEVADI